MDREHLANSWFDQARKHLAAAKENLDGCSYAAAVREAQECAEFSVKSVLTLLCIEFPPVHGWNHKQLKAIAQQIQERQLLIKIGEQHLSHVNLPRIIRLTNTLAHDYMAAKYGFEDSFLAASDDLFIKKDACCAIELAEDCLQAASHFRYLETDRLAALLSPV